MHITQLLADDAEQSLALLNAEQPPRTRALLSPLDPRLPVETVHLGIFDDTQLTAVVTLEARGRGVYEVHLALKRGRGVDHLLPAFFSIRQELFTKLNARELVGWVPTLHTGIQKVAHTVGFEWSGATLLQMSGKRLVEWRQLVLKG